MYQNESNKNITFRIIRMQEVLTITGLSRSTIYRRIESGDFPVPISLGGKSIGFLSNELDEWIRSLQRI